jgi:Fur family ferric uptake transcriptional regulator
MRPRIDQSQFLTVSRIATKIVWMSAQHQIGPAERLRSNGLQVTAQRLAVLRAVERLPHGTTDEVADAVRDEIGAISRQAVYDALGVLGHTGMIRRIQPARSPARFEPAVDDNHHHLVCRVCGRIVDVQCGHGSAPCLTAADDAGFAIDEAEVIYWGRCPECQKTIPNEASAEIGSET